MRVRVWDTGGGDRPILVAPQGIFDAVGFDEPGGRLLIGGETEVDLANGETFSSELSTLSDDVRFSADGRLAVVADLFTSRKSLKLRLMARDALGWRERWRRRVPVEIGIIGSSSLAVSSCGSRVVRAAWRQIFGPALSQQTVRVYAADTGRCLAAWSGELWWDIHRSSAVSAGAAWFAALGGRSFYAVNPWEPASEAVKRTHPGRTEWTGLAFAPDGRTLATAGNDGAVMFWDTATWTVNREYRWEIGRLRSVAFAPDGLRCAAGSDTGKVVVWDVDV